jgi:hypothetical protein
MSEITKARMNADIEAVRIAEIYAEHPLLKNMPIPRFRLPTVEIDLPVLVDKITGTEPGVSPKLNPDIKDLKLAFTKSMSMVVKELKIKLTKEQIKKITLIINKDLEDNYNPDEPDFNARSLADRLTKISTISARRIGGIRDAAIISGFKTKLESLSRKQFLSIKTFPPRLQVLVTSSDIREVGSKENLTIFRLKISEEAYEWTSIETEDGTKRQLVIE